MTKPWSDSDLARLSADLDAELETIFSQVEETLALGDHPEGSDEAEMEGRSQEANSALQPRVIAPADLLADDDLLANEFDISVAAPDGEESELADFPASGPALNDETWLEPGLLGDPEMAPAPAALTPEAIQELSRIIEAAVAKGVAAALEKMRR